MGCVLQVVYYVTSSNSHDVTRLMTSYEDELCYNTRLLTKMRNILFGSTFAFLMFTELGMRVSLSKVKFVSLC